MFTSSILTDPEFVLYRALAYYKLGEANGEVELASFIDAIEPPDYGMLISGGQLFKPAGFISEAQKLFDAAMK